MALDCHVGSFNITTGAATTTQDVTDPGFQPLAVIFWWSGDTSSSDAVAGGSHRRGMGFAVSSSDRRCISAMSEDAGASSVTYSIQRIDKCISILADGIGTQDGEADLSTMLATGFRIVIDDQFTAAYRIHYMALGGADLTDAETGIFDESGSTGNRDITSVSFQPDCVLFISSNSPSASSAGNADSGTMIGFATSSSERGVVLGVSNSGSSTMNTRAYSYSGECIARPASNILSIITRVDFVSFLSNGFRLNGLEEGGGSSRTHYLALKGGNYKVGNLLTRTDGNDITESGFGFTPTGVLFLSHCKAESTQDTWDDDDEISIGAASATDERAAIGNIDEDNTANAEVALGQQHDGVYLNIATDDTAEGIMDLKSLDADGLTCVMDDADASAAIVHYLAFGPAAAVGTGVKNPLLMGRNPLIGPIG